MMNRRHWLAATCVSLGMTVSSVSWAQGYPNQPIRLVVPFAPGGAVDQTARIISGALGDRLGQQIIVENKPGASGSLAASEVARAKPDGYTIMLALDSQAVNHHIVKSLPFDTFNSFDYLGILVTTPQILVVRNEIPVKNLDELVAYLKANPKATYGSAGTASAGHVNSAQLGINKGLKTEHAPYKGAAPMMADLMGGHIDYAFGGLSVLLPHVKAEKVRAIAVSSPKRSSKLPDVPAMNEFIPGFEYPTWIGYLAPKGLPLDVHKKITTAFSDVMQDPQIVKRFNENAFDIVNGTPEMMAQRVRKDSDVMAELVKQKIVDAN
ncbi:Bug family tripartite tricarboxylate transporter substrate binding protein [Comamonas jiangduensis]|uniref:Bug family tripartite tricarboxylate transporter substrate binding protein n=1 Tax=Comamonas jiangduensis TaxID=1194168 RepID=UPI0024E1162C|nr:tripartite tricarboxylate transporter substrate binding protein [Comamonas jiangduensis]